ncbi:bifunctional DNA primase/polymerase [Mycobacterium kansasii]
MANNSDAHRYALDRPAAEAWADFWIALGAHVLPLRKDGSKKPLNPGWPDARAMTRDDIVTWLMQGGGIGVNLGKSGWVGADADNAAATDLFRSAGLVRTVITANSQVEGAPKFGGGQFLMYAPDGYDPDTLHSRAFELPCGAKGDMLGGRRYIVVPPTRLDEAGGRSYMPDPEGIWGGTGAPMRKAGPWIVDPNVQGDFGRLTPLLGLLGPRKPHEREYDPDGEWRTERQQQIDEIPWERVFDCAEGHKFTADSTDSCGCAVYAYAGQTSKDGRGLTAHDGCSWGWYGATWSGTARAHYDLPQTTDRLRIAARLRHLDTDGEVALGRSWRVGFGGFRDFADTMDEAAERYEDFADDPEKCTGTAHVLDPDVRPTVTSFNPHVAVTRPDAWRVVPADRQHWIRQAGQCRAVARQLRSGKPAAPQGNGETYLNGPVIGAEVPPQPVSQPADPAEPIDAETVELPGQEPPTDTAPAVDDAIDAELLDGLGTDRAAECRRILRELRAKIIPIEQEMAKCTPGLQRLSDFAESRGVFPHGLAGAAIPRILAPVPPNVVFPPPTRLCEHKVEGQGVNGYVVNVAATSAGKGRTDSAAEAAFPLQNGVVTTGTGTSEAWSKKLRGVQDGKPYIKTTSLLINVDEMDSLNGFLSQPGNKLPGWLASTFMSGYGGQETSDEKNSAPLPKHGSRIGILINAQPVKMGTLAALDGIGVGARFGKGMAGVVRKADRGPLYGKSVAAVLADQTGQPWYHTGHVGEPPYPHMQPQSARDAATAAGAAPPIVNLGHNEDGDRVGVTGFDDAPPFWIQLPECAWEDIAAGEDVAAERAADLELAFDQDAEGIISGHRILVVMHVSFAFAVLDGKHAVEEAHWKAAKLFMQGSDLVAAMCGAWLELASEAEVIKANQLKGVGNAVARAADATVTNGGVARSRHGIIRVLSQAPGLTMKPGYLNSGFKVGDKTVALSKAQKRHAAQAAEQMERSGELRKNADGSWTLLESLAIAA